MPWVNRPQYSDMSTADQENNVSMIYSVLGSMGWTINAVSGICGCIQRESRFDPWAWQKNRIQSTAIKNEIDPRGRAYGLIQWDSCNNYILSPVAIAAPGYGPNFSDQPGSQEDGNAQLTLINTGEGYYPRGDYSDLKFSDFKSSTREPEYLGPAWLINRQRPASAGATAPIVAENARRWYEYLLTAQPPDPNKFLVTVSTSPAGAGSVSGGGLISPGTQVTIYVEPNEGYTFSHWKVGGTLSRENPYTFIPLQTTTCVAILNGGGSSGGDKPLPTPITRGEHMPIPLYLKHRRR